MVEAAEAATLPGDTPSPAGVPGVHVSLPEDVLGTVGKALGVTGQDVQKLGDVYATHALRLAGINNQASADAANQGFSKEAEELRAKFEIQNQYVDPQHSDQLLADFNQQIEGLRQKYRSGLTNPMAAQMYDSDSRRMQNILMGNGATTVAHGTDQFRAKAFEGNQSLLESQAAATSDPAMQEEIKNRAAQAAYARGQELHMPDDMVQAGVLASTSAINSSILEQMIKVDAHAANAYFQKNRGEMTAQAQGAYGQKIEENLYAQDAAQIGDKALAQAQAFSPTGPVTGDANNFFQNGILWMESRNGRGSLLNPQSGAEGVGQLLPKTAQAEAAKLGLPWRPDLMQSKAPEAIAYQTKLSQAYWNEAVTAEHGDLYRAAMYYYGGPDEAGWKAKTHAYAADVIAHIQGAGGALTNVQANMPAAYKSVDDMVTDAAKADNLNPDILRGMAEAKFGTNVARDEKAQDASTAATRSDILGSIIGDGTPQHPPITDVTQLPSLPGWDKLLPEQKRRLSLVVTQQLAQSSQNTLAYIEGQRAQPGGDKWFMGQDFTGPAYQGKLNAQSLKNLEDEKIRVQAQQTKEQNYGVTLNQIKQNGFITDTLTQAKIIDKNGNPIDQTKYNVFLGAMFTEMRAWHAQNKGPMQQDQMNTIAQQILSRNLSENTPLLTQAGSIYQAKTGVKAEAWDEGEIAERYAYANQTLTRLTGRPPSQDEIKRFVRIKFGE